MQYLCGSELQSAQSVGHRAGVGTKRVLCPGSRRYAAHRNGSHSEHTSQNCKLTCYTDANAVIFYCVDYLFISGLKNITTFKFDILFSQSAHMAVLEAMMVLQVREIISNERVMNTVQRYGPNVHPRKSKVELKIIRPTLSFFEDKISSSVANYFLPL